MYDPNYLIPGELLICKMKSFCAIKTTNFIPQDCSEWIIPENEYKDHALPWPQRQVLALLGGRGIPLAMWHKRLPSLHKTSIHPIRGSPNPGLSVRGRSQRQNTLSSNLRVQSRTSD